MALTKCKECGHEISKNAVSCPNCGAKNKHTTIFTKIVAVFFSVVFLMTVIGQCSSNTQSQKGKDAVTTNNRESEDLIWNYSESQDEMGRGHINIAMVKSLNKFEFDFPYKKPQRATLHLRKHPKYGDDVIVSIERGQFLCPISDCSVDVRFDDKKIQSYEVNRPTDHDTTIIFISDSSTFLKNLKTANHLRIEANFFHEGAHVLEFNVSNLKW